MKAFIKTLLAIATTSVLALGAQANVGYGTQSQAYVGVKAGQFDLDKVQGHKGNLTAYGVYGGYNFDQNFGVEAEYQSADSDKYKVGTSERELKAKTYGAYGTYQYHLTNTPVYVKGKLGLAKTEVESKATNGNFSSTSDKTSLAGGVGIGFKPTNNFGVEATYNYLNTDASIWGVGAHLAF